MRQKLSRILAACLVTAMIFSGNISGTALAFEGDEAGTQKEEMQTNKQENVNNEDIQEEKNTGGSDNTESKTGSEGEPALQEPEEEKQSSDDAAIDVETETQTPELQKSQETQLSVNYIYMDKLSVYSGEIQNVVLSLNQGTSQIENVVLVYSDDAGNKYQWQSEKDNSGLFLFEKTVAEETKGIYHIISINYTESGEEKEMLLSDIDMNISFGINCEYDGNNSSESLEMEPMGQEPEVSATVATIDENGILNETAELGVAEALTELGKETKSTQLRYRSAKSGNVVVVLDPGHDSGHAGAQGNGVQEEIATLKIAQYCKEELEKYSGVTVYMTRTTAACPFPETVGVGSGNILDIKKRVQWAASKGADAFVSFHLDSAGASAHGAHVYYPGDWFANNNIVSQGANLANAIQNELVGIGLYNRGTESADYSVNTESAIYGFPGLIIEHAFLTNVNDANTYLKTEAGLKKLGVADANGIVKYFGLTKGQWVQEGDKWKYKENGVFVVSDWRSINGREYYFNKSGYRVTGWENIGGKEYYFMPEGYMWIGWASFGGERYYFDGNGRMIEGVYTVEGIQYQFNSKGILIGECSKYYMIEGATETTINQMINYYQSSGHRYPAEVLKKGGAETLEKFCTIFYNEALKENIKAEVAFVQTMKETGWLQFGGDVKIEQFNFAGLGATGNGVSGNSFKDVETGVRAQIQHLKAYGSVLPLNQICVDQRFEYVKRGSAIYVEWLGIPDNPDGKGWASAEGYGFDLHKMIDKLLACGR
ncbi:MAG: N-acetylmuramoyl-L-alanine amidase [Bariatricus massiliensis]|nr:N-acetylmuramoyl-L-alanine amidase [Bariatricus massiliensis]